MRFNITDTSKQNVKVVQHIKIPYAGERLDIVKTQYNAYNNIYNTLYQASNNEHITYFFVRSNYVYYHRQASNTSPMFSLDILQGEHRILDTSHLMHKIKDKGSMLVKTENGKWYIITNNVDFDELQECVAVIDAVSGNNIYIESRKNNVFLDIFPPISNNIVPILQITGEHIKIHMIELTSERFDTISWHLSELKNIVSKVVAQDRRHVERVNEIVLSDSLILIEEFSKENFEYVYRVDGGGNSYLEAIKIDFILSVQGKMGNYKFGGFQINIELVGDRIICHLNILPEFRLGHPFIQVVLVAGLVSDLARKAVYLLYDEKTNRKIMKSFYREYPHTVSTKSNYLSNILYSNICGSLVSSSYGLDIIISKSRTMHHYDDAIMYRYKGYIIILAGLINQQNQEVKRIFVIDTKNDLVGIWETNKGRSAACESESAMYNCYHLKKIRNVSFHFINP
jgi:hypothetical protein